MQLFKIWVTKLSWGYPKILVQTEGEKWDDHSKKTHIRNAYGGYDCFYGNKHRQR